MDILDKIVLWLHKTFQPSESEQREIERLCEDSLYTGMIDDGATQEEAIKAVKDYRSIGR